MLDVALKRALAWSEDINMAKFVDLRLGILFRVFTFWIVWRVAAERDKSNDMRTDAKR